MKRAKKMKTKRTAKKTAVRASAKSARRAPLKSKKRHKASGAATRKPVVNGQAKLMPVVTAETSEPNRKMSPLFWPALPFAMMNMWWRPAKQPLANV